MPASPRGVSVVSHAGHATGSPPTTTCCGWNSTPQVAQNRASSRFCAKHLGADQPARARREGGPAVRAALRARRLLVVRGTRDVVGDVLGKPTRDEQPPRSRAVAHPTERAPRPVPLRLSLARGLDRLGDERLRDPACDEVGLDAEAARAARAERARAVVCVRDVADPAELATARDRRRRRLPPIAERDEARLEVRLGARPATEPARRDVERRRCRPRSRTGRP
jgi:hypothetical protein